MFSNSVRHQWGDGIANLFVLARFTACEHKRVWK